MMLKTLSVGIDEWLRNHKQFTLLTHLNKYPRIIAFIYKNTEFLDKYDVIKNGRHSVSLFERLFCIQHNLTSRPKCQKCHTNEVCGFDAMKRQYRKWCSPQCQASDNECITKSKLTRLELYGDENYINIEKSRETRMYKNCGSWSPDDFAEKCRKTKRERYGDETYTNSEKAKKTLAKHIDENPNFWKDRENKIKATKIANGHDPNWNNREKFSQTVSNFSNERQQEINEKRRQTNIKENGYEFPMQDQKIREKTSETVFERYGVRSVLQRPDIRDAARLKKKQSSWYKIRADIANYSPLFTFDEFVSNTDSNFYWKWKCQRCGNIFQSRYDDGHHTVCRKCHPFKSHVIDSKGEHEIIDMLSHYFKDIIHQDRTILNPKELDVLVKEKNVAFEFDGLYWHSEEYKPNDYHLMKTKMCKLKGVKLIHVFESEWKSMRQIAESYVKRAVGVFDKSFDACDLRCQKIISEDALHFYKENDIDVHKRHLDNSYGFFDGDNLIAAYSICINDSKAKIVKFATRLHTDIVNIIEQMTQCIFSIEGVNEIEISVDRRWSDGSDFLNAGYRLTSVSEPDFYYVNTNDEEWVHQPSDKFRKQFVMNVLGKSFDNSKSQEQNLADNGFIRIYDCGQIVLTMSKQTYM